MPRWAALTIVLLLAASARAEWVEMGTYRVTGYCPCVRCCGKSDGITADGTNARTSPDRVVAAPREFPFGTRLWIDGIGLAVVHDRGGKIKGRRMEAFFADHQSALNWGVQKQRVFIWKGASPPTTPRPH